jgi:Tol biopolymer transport system component
MTTPNGWVRTAVSHRIVSACAAAAGAFLLPCVTGAQAADTELVSVTAFTRVAAGGSALEGTSSLSANGRYVVFRSWRSTLVAKDTNGSSDIFVRDRATRMTERVSVSSGGLQMNAGSRAPVISADGRFVAFQSRAAGFVPGDVNEAEDIFRHDRWTGRTILISRASNGARGNAGSFSPAISANGRFVAFMSNATNLAPGASGWYRSVYVRDVWHGTTRLVSVNSQGEEGQGDAYSLAISADGRFVAFSSGAGNLAANDLNVSFDVFVRDLQARVTELISVTLDGFSGQSFSLDPSISADGRYVAFTSWVRNLVPNDENGYHDAFVRDRQTRTTERISLAANGAELAVGGAGPTISADGRYVSFVSIDPDVVSGDTNGVSDAFVCDRLLRTVTRVSVGTDGVEGFSPEGVSASISADGKSVAFDSYSRGLLPNDTNSSQDVFVRALAAPTGGEMAASH